MTHPSKVIRFCVAGITGQMGREVVRTLPQWKGLELVSGVASKAGGLKLQDILGQASPDLIIGGDLRDELRNKKFDVLVDLTRPEVAVSHALWAIEKGVSPIIGTSGLEAGDLEVIEKACESKKVPAWVIPNFSVGAVLGMRFAQLAAQWIADVEIIEMHHEKKLDAPSGTALETARLIQKSRLKVPTVPETKVMKAQGARGAQVHEVPIHSVRLSGFLAQQMIIFGAPGETLEIKHSVIDRSTYMGGVELSIRKVRALAGLTIGLESVLFQ